MVVVVVEENKARKVKEEERIRRRTIGDERWGKRRTAADYTWMGLGKFSLPVRFMHR